MTASVGPGCPGNELLAQLAAHDLFFPAGHCPGVGARRLPAAGRLRLERPRPRPGLHERRGDRRRDRRRASSCAPTPTQQRRPAVGRARLGPGLLRRRHALPPARCTRGRRSSPTASTSTRSSARGGLHAGRRDRPADAARDGDDALHPPRRRRASRRSRSPGRCSMDSEDEARAALALLETCPAASRAKAAIPYVPGADGGPLRRARTRPTPTTTATRSTTCGRTRRSTSCCRACGGSRETLPAGALAHAVDELGRRVPRAARHGLQRRGRDLHRALRGLARSRRTTPRTSPWADGQHARDGAPRDAASSSPTRTSAARPARFVSDANYARLDALRAAVRPGRAVPPLDGRP